MNLHTIMVSDGLNPEKIINLLNNNMEQSTGNMTDPHNLEKLSKLANMAIENSDKMINNESNIDILNQIQKYVDENLYQLEHQVKHIQDSKKVNKFLQLKEEYLGAFNNLKQLQINNKNCEANKLVHNIKQGLEYNITNNYQNDPLATEDDKDMSYFALLIAVMLYCYANTADFGKLVLIKQKNAQGAAEQITQLQKLFLELKELINDGSIIGADGKPVTDLYSLFVLAFKNKPPVTDSEKKANQILSKYVTFLEQVKDGSGNSIIDNMKWDGSDATKFATIMNGTIELINKKLKDNGIPDSMMINLFDISNGKEKIPYGDKTAGGSYPLVGIIDAQGKTGESVANQLTTLNQNIQASANQATESVKSLLEWLKQSINSYGVAMNPR